MVTRQEALAQTLAAQLDAAVHRAGKRWYVDVGSPPARSVSVQCLWYERALASLFAGQSPAIETGLPAAARTFGEGAEYRVALSDRGERVSTGRTRTVAEVIDAVRAWMAGADLAQIVEAMPFLTTASGDPVSRLPEVTSAREADVVDLARHRWRLKIEQASDPEDTLAPLRELLEAMAENPIIGKFHTYTSLYWLCFSASSHHPWVDPGVPMIARHRGERRYRFGTKRLGLASVVARTEAILASSPVQPFVGSAYDLLRPRLAAQLARLGSSLQPRVEPADAGVSYRFPRLIVGQGERRCQVGEHTVTLIDHDETSSIEWRTDEEMAGFIHRYLDEGRSIEEVIAVATSTK